MEAHEQEDPLAAPPSDDDPFAGVPADGGEGEEGLVTEGKLEGENPSEEPEGAAEPEPSPDEVLADPEAEGPEDEEPAPPEPEPEPEAPAPEPEPEPEPKPEPRAKKRKAKGKGSGAPEREYVVVQLDEDDKPIAVVGRETAREAKSARHAVFASMEEDSAKLVAVPARYWQPKRLRAEARTQRAITEE